jgi:FkbM family methyltransferase
MSIVARAKPWLVASGLYRPVRFAYRHLLHREGLRALKEQVAFYREFVSPGDLCFDIGANRGHKSEALLRIGARVVAVEPLPQCAAELRERLGHFRDFVCIESAVGDHQGTATLHVAECDVLSSVDPNWFDQSATWSASIPVTMTTLDALIAAHGVPRYCKLDVEGLELEALRGLSRPLPSLSFEFHIGHDANEKTLACLDRLQRFGSYMAAVSKKENPRFVMPWTESRAFAAYFESTLAHDETFEYGEIYVRYSP